MVVLVTTGDTQTSPRDLEASGDARAAAWLAVLLGMALVDRRVPGWGRWGVAFYATLFIVRGVRARSP